MAVMGEPVPLSELARDLPEPAVGWAVELERRGIEIVEDDLGRAAITRAVARAIFAEHRENEVLMARHREEIEQRVIAADEARRAAMPRGVPAGMIPAGLTGGQMMMAADPMSGARRESPVEHALRNSGSAVYHPLPREESS
jgi:hypothetical protein